MTRSYSISILHQTKKLHFSPISPGIGKKHQKLLKEMENSEKEHRTSIKHSTLARRAGGCASLARPINFAQQLAYVPLSCFSCIIPIRPLHTTECTSLPTSRVPHRDSKNAIFLIDTRERIVYTQNETCR